MASLGFFAGSQFWFLLCARDCATLGSSNVFQTSQARVGSILSQLKFELTHFSFQIVSYLLDLPEKDEEEVERAQINSFDSLWGETGTSHGHYSLLSLMCLCGDTLHLTP